MSTVKADVDEIEIVADRINNFRRVYSAVRDGKKHLETSHPDVKADVAATCIEMRKILQSIGKASSIVNHFRFNNLRRAVTAEPHRSNDYLMQYKTLTMSVESQIDYLRGHCRKIGAHAHEFEKEVKESKLSGMLILFRLNSE